MRSVVRIAVAVLCSLWLAGCAATAEQLEPPEQSEPSEQSAAYTARGQHTAYVVSHGWHTCIVLPAGSMVPALPELGERFEQAVYLEFGWGDRAFYQAPESTLGLTLQALLWPTDSVMHVVALPEDVAGYFAASDAERLCLNERELASLRQFMAASFARDAQGSLIPLSPGLYGDSQFYQGVGCYSLASTCNQWTARGLNRIGLDLVPAFNLTADSLMEGLRQRLERLGEKARKAAMGCAGH